MLRRSSLSLGLPRDAWLLQLGGVMNAFGTGVVAPFLVIYFHDVRHFSLGLSGLIVAVAALSSLVAGLAAGPGIDRLGPKAMLTMSLVLQAIGFGLFPLVHHPAEAFLFAAIEGAGAAGFWPGQSTLLARLVRADVRHTAYAQQRVSMNLGIGLGGLVGGLIADTARPGSFTVLFVLDACTFLAYIGALGFISDPGLSAEERGDTPSSYRAVLRDGLFVRMWVIGLFYVMAGYALLNLVPPFIRDHAHVAPHEIGAIFFVNTVVVTAAQLPIARALEGRRRLPALALMPALWAVAWLLIEAGGLWLEGTAAFVIAALALAIFGVGECFQGPAYQTLTADIAPPHLRGRYFSLVSLGWGAAYSIGPAIGGFVLGSAPFALFPAAAAVCVGISVAALVLERHVPPHLRRIAHPSSRTPQPAPT